MTTWTLLDTETDGLEPPIHVIDVAAQRFDGLTPIGDPFQVFINHEISIPEDAIAIHGYTTDFIIENGVPPSEGYGMLRQYIEDNPVVAHYLAFDWDRVLVPELIRLREKPIGRRGFCSWLLSRRAMPEHPTHRLDYLRDHHDLACTQPHTALGDVESIADLLTRIIFPRLLMVGIDSIEGVRDFAALLPVLRAKCLIQGLDYEEEAKKVVEVRKEKRRLEKYISEIEYGDIPIPSLILDNDLIEEEPKIEFSGKTFLFTGKMIWGTRSQAAKKVKERGGVVSKSKSLTKNIDYFVLGEDKDKGWTALLYGSKLTVAFFRLLREPTRKLKIIREQDFISALQDENKG